jgi:lipopolysaccharide export system protein LptA
MMRATIARLRFWLVALALLLVAALGVFYAVYKIKARHLVSDLPGKLGLNIGQSSDSYTLSQTGKNGRTSFTIQASKAIKFKDGEHFTLRDVVITLYGAQSDRNDRIAGKEFDYDQKTGVIVAQGEVQIDLQGADPLANGAKAANAPSAERQPTAPSPGAVHVRTSGLTFNQKTQVATTSQYVDFQTPKASGHSTGATYDVQRGLLVLDSKVEIESSRDGKEVLLRAAHGEFTHGSMQAFLLNPSTDYQTDHASSDQAIVYFRKDGSAEHVDAQGHIHLKTDGGQEMTASIAKLLLDAKSELQRAELSGGVNFASAPSAGDANPHQMHGNAVEATVEFGPNGTLRHGQARNAVSFVDQQRGLSGDPQGSATREMRAAQVDIDFSQGRDGRSIADRLLAAGGAAAVLHTIPTKGPSQNTTVKGDQLLAVLQDGRAISSLHGTGHTSVLETADSGASDLSTGDLLQVTFAPAGNAGAKSTPPNSERQGSERAAGAAPGTGSQIETFMQEGNVAITQRSAAGAATHATANRADYTAANQILRLTGSPRVEDETTDLAATTIDFHRDSSMANANGNVKATYLQPKAASAGAASSPAGFGAQGPTHVIASSAILDQAHGEATFRGKARLWQGANSVDAPVIEIRRSPESLKAYADPANPGAVSTVLANASGKRQTEVSRIQSRQLFYTDADHRAQFTGSVVSEDASGTVHCDQAEVFLAPSTRGANIPTTEASGRSRIDHIVATGHVVLQQPGRRGTGERLLYTASDGRFVLTGTPAVLPHLYDQAHGNVTGEALIFNSRDDSVSVTGGQSKAVTDTRTAK